MRRPFPHLMIRPVMYVSPSGKVRAAFWLGFVVWHDWRGCWDVRFNRWTWRP